MARDRFGASRLGTVDLGQEGRRFVALVPVSPVAPVLGVAHLGTVAERRAVESSKAGTVTVETDSL